MPTDWRPIYIDYQLDKKISPSHTIQREMYWGIRTRLPSLQCPMLHHHDVQKTQNHYAIPQSTSGENNPKRSCLPNFLCTLYSVLCQTNQPAFTNLLQRASKNQGSVKTHLHQCNTTITEEHIDVLSSTSRWESHLLTLEALYIQELYPKINTKDEYRSRTLTIRI